METVTMKGGNNNIITYERENADATAYHKDTPMEVRRILENALRSRNFRTKSIRLRLWYGDTTTGRDWHEENDVSGYIGKSGGDIQVPLLIHNSRSIGGGAILDHCIVKIQEGHNVLYQHPKYYAGEFSIVSNRLIDYPFEAHIDGLCHARFRTEEKAQRWVDFMTGKRLSK